MINKLCLTIALVLIGNMYTIADTVIINAINYQLDEANLEAMIVQSDSFADKELVIPSVISVDDVVYDVTSVGLRAFENCSLLESVTISEGVRSLGNYSFRCENLRAIYLPASIVYIHENAFINCSKVEDVYSYAEIPIAFDSDPFYDIAQNNAILHVPYGASDAYAVMSGWKRFKRIVDDIDNGSKYSVTLSASQGGSLMCFNTEVQGRQETVEVDGSAESVVVSAVPAHGYEFKSLTVTRRDGELIHYSFEHRGGDIIATIPLEDGMLVSAYFVEPEVYNLQVKLGDGGRYDVPVNSDKSYSFKYAAPNGWAVSSVTFNDERMDVAGVGGNTVSITTPKLSEDSQLNIVIHDIQTGVERAKVNAPVVRQVSDRVIVEGLALGAEVFLTDSTGHTTVYHASGGVATIDALTDGVYLITTSGYTFKIRH